MAVGADRTFLGALSTDSYQVKPQQPRRGRHVTFKAHRSCGEPGQTNLGSSHLRLLPYPTESPIYISWLRQRVLLLSAYCELPAANQELLGKLLGCRSAPTA